MILIWHPLALDDLAQIIGYCRHNFGMQTAKRVRTKYRSDINLLKTQPYLGFVEPLLKDVGSLEYHSLIIDCTKVIYTIHPEYVYIHILWNCRRQPERLCSEIENRTFVSL